MAWTGAAEAADSPRVELHTSKGVIVIELDSEKAPRTPYGNPRREEP